MRRTAMIGVMVAAMVAGSLTPAIAGSSRPPTRPGPVPGLVVTESTRGFADTVDALVAVIGGSPASVVTVIDHAAAAASVGRTLEPTTVVYFGNPVLGTPLMQADQVAGIDLPQKILVWQARGRVYVAYNGVDYLAARHDVDGVATLGTIAGALATFTAAATDVDVADVGTAAPQRHPGLLRLIARHPGLRSIASERSFDETVAALTAAIEAAPTNLVLTLDHQANAAGAGLELRPTTLLVFGNPNLGTPLMQRRRTIAIDLPQKFLVHEAADGAVTITWNEPDLIALRHRTFGARDTLATIAGALEALATTAAGAG